MSSIATSGHISVSRVAVKSRISLCRKEEPNLVHDRACVVKDFIKAQLVSSHTLERWHS